MIQQLLTIARNTFTESIRQPIYVVMLVLTALLLIFVQQAAQYTFDDDNKLMLEMGLNTICLAGMFLAAFTATGVLANEIENRTALTVVSKPIQRPVFVLGKYLGVSAALTLAYWIIALTFLLVTRQGVLMTVRDPIDWPTVTFGLVAWLGALVLAAAANYYYHWVFTSAFVTILSALLPVAFALTLLFNKEWAFQGFTPNFVGTVDEPAPFAGGYIFVGLVLLFELILLLTSVAIAASTRLGQIWTIMICFIFYFVGMVMNPTVLAARTTGSPGRGPWIAALHRALPRLDFLWPIDAITVGRPIPAIHVLWATAYTALFIAAILLIAIGLFQTREVG